MQWQLMSILDFYPRPPRGGRLLAQQTSQHLTKISIHALREEGDAAGPLRSVGRVYFYPRPPRGGRPRTPAPMIRVAMISIHALREEGDSRSELVYSIMGISIHALREEGDWVMMR